MPPSVEDEGRRDVARETEPDAERDENRPASPLPGCVFRGYGDSLPGVHYEGSSGEFEPNEF